MTCENDFPDNPIAERLGRAIEQLQKNVRQVEIWAGALAAYAQPVAGYALEEHRLSRQTAKNAAQQLAAAEAEKPRILE